MKNRLIAITMAALVAATYSGYVHAQSSERVDSVCGTTLKRSTSFATCLDGDITSELPLAGVISPTWRWTVTNKCSNYGQLIVSVDVRDADDFKVTMPTSYANSYTGTSGQHRIDSIACCLDQSDLCYKNQVEADANGFITSMSVSSTMVTVTTVNVSTHQRRYDFCQANPSNLYCTIDPEGDANTDPQASGACNGEACTIQDCRDGFAESHAAGSPGSCTDLTLTYPDWSGDSTAPEADRTDDVWALSDNMCTVTGADCSVDGSILSTDFYDSHGDRESTLDIVVHDMDDIRFCTWQACENSRPITIKGLTFGECPTSVDSCN